jgi:putative peptide zinc metalloprotease protein
VITAWVMVTVPLMAFMLLTLLTSLPRMLGTAWDVEQDYVADLQEAWRSGTLVDISADVLQVLAVALPVLAGVLIFGRVGLRWSRSLARWSRGSALKRIAAVALATVVVTALSWAWGPRPGNYRPIGPDEKGLLSAVLPGAQNDVGAMPASAERARALPGEGDAVGTSAKRRLVDDTPLQATFQKGTALPSKSEPRLAMVLVPTDNASGGHTQTPEAPAEPWVFPFDKPLPAAAGDNQAGAYNTQDNTVKYDVAFALVWVTDNEVLNVNEAHAYASCSNCVTVAVAFQVLLIMDDAQVVVPQNLAVAANYDCYRCITAAIASQLVLSVEKAPGTEQRLALAEVWGRLTEFGTTITAYSLSEIAARLDAFKSEIAAILDSAPPVQPGTTTTPSASGTSAGGTTQPSPSGSAGSQSSSSPTRAPSSAPGSPGPGDGVSTEGTSGPTAEPTTPAPTPEPEPTGSATSRSP